MVGKLNKSPPKSDRFLDRVRTINRVLAKKGTSTRQQTDDDSENLSNIDDAEVSGYINSKTEFLLKKIIWEKINKEHVKKRKQPKFCTKIKKTTASEKPAKDVNSIETREKLSSKINFAALDRLFDSNEVQGTARVEEGSGSDQNGKKELQNSTKERLSDKQGSEENVDMKDESGDEDDIEEDDLYEDGEQSGDLDLENEYENEDGGYCDDYSYD